MALVQRGALFERDAHARRRVLERTGRAGGRAVVGARDGGSRRRARATKARRWRWHSAPWHGPIVTVV